MTVSATVVLLLKLPEVPVTLTDTVPSAAALLAISVNVLVLLVVVGLNEAVTPLGRPEADRLTLPLKPFCGVTVIVLVPLVPPGARLKELGEAESVKPGIGLTGVLIATLSKVAVARELEPLLAARPI